MYFFQDRMLYIPNVPSADLKFPECNPQGFKSPTEHLMDFEDVSVTTSDGIKLKGWFIKQPMPEQVQTIIYFHENAGNIGFRLPNLQRIYEKWEANILIVGYRGYGHSEGIPSEAGLKLDSLAVLDWALKNNQIDKSKIFVFGRSLGGSVALYLAAHRKEHIQGLILENTFTSISDMVDQIFPYICVLKSLILRIEWNSKDLIKDLEVPMLFISGRNDQIVPPIQMDTLFEQAKKSKYTDMFRIEFGTHNESWLMGGDEYYTKIKEFINFVWLNQKQEETS